MLEQQREEIMRRTQELEQKLKVLPTVIEAQEEQRDAWQNIAPPPPGRAISPYAIGRRAGAGLGPRNPHAVATALCGSAQDSGAADRASHHFPAPLARCSRELETPGSS